MPRQLAMEWLRAGPGADRREHLARGQDAGLDAEELALAARLVALSWRRLGTLRALVTALVPRAPKADLAAALHVGLAELLFLPGSEDRAVLSGAAEAAAQFLDEPRAHKVYRVLAAAVESRRPGHSGDGRRDLVAAPWHLEQPVFRDPAPHRFLWCEDALSLPAPLAKRWCAKVGWDRTLERALASLVELPRSEWDEFDRAVLELAAPAPEERWAVWGASPEAEAEWSGRGAELVTAGGKPLDGAYVAASGSDSARLASRPEARWRTELRSPGADSLERLTAAAQGLRPGGRLVLGVRSLDPGETTALLRAFEREQPSMEVIESELREGSVAPPREGGFLALLRAKA